MESKSNSSALVGIETALTTLQPIRDLAQNWDIDIAACLDEYLEDLEFTQETRERIVQVASNTNANFNFAQAAIVLQNSSGIYSRKVDFLHSHVFKIQDDLFQAFHPSGSNNPKGSRKSLGIDSEIEAFLNFDPHQEFLPLNDVIPVCSPTETGLSIDLSESVDIRNSSFLPRRSIGGQSIRRSMSSASRRHDRTSFGVTSFFAEQTMMTEGDNMTGLASRLSILASVDTGSLRLQSGVCDIGDDGILRMPGSSIPESKDENSVIDSQQDINMNDTSFAAVDEQNGMTIDDDNDDHGGFFAADNDDEEILTDVGSAKGVKRRVTFADSSVLPSSRWKGAAKPMEDPWALLSWDAHDTRKPRPLRIGKTIVLPEAVDKPPSECVTGARTRQSARIKTMRIPRKKILLQSSNTSTDSFQTISLGKKRSLEQSSGNSGFLYGQEFAYIAKATVQRQREVSRLKSRASDHSVSRNILLPEPDDGLSNSKENFADDGAAYFDGDDDDDLDHGAAGAFDKADNSAPFETNTGITSMDDIYHIRNKEGENDENDSKGLSFEELCRAHIAAFAKGAEKYAMESKLSARVGQWQVKLLPLLEEEERRPAFDIHAYGETIIHKMEKQINNVIALNEFTVKPNKTVAFSYISQDCQPFDVCRLFLAALSLSNSQNLKVTSESTLNSLQFELLSCDMERPMEAYFAPSVMDTTA